MAIYTSMEQLIGATPLLELCRFSKYHQLSCRILAKLESHNPGGSVKDRVALSMLEDAQAQGRITADTRIIEPTSGNTGIALAAISAARGLKCTIVMPENMSLERRMLIAAYGADLVLTPAEQAMAGAIAAANALAAEIPNSFVPSQFTNLANPAAHRTTVQEIWDATGGSIHILVAGVGTGGTITGMGQYLKKRDPGIQIIAVEPAASAVLSGGPPGCHGIQGIGPGFFPHILDRSLLDEILPVTQNDAITAAKLLARHEGILAGISSGAVLWAALAAARRPENSGKVIVTLFPDSGERYLSSSIYA